MGFDRYPNAATLTIAAAGRQSTTTGQYSAGTSSVVSIPRCRIEPSARYVVGANGDRVDITATIFAPTTSLVIPAGAKIQVLGREYTVVDTPPRQKITEIACQ